MITMLFVASHNIDWIVVPSNDSSTHIFLYPLCFYLHVVIRCHVSKHALQVTVANRIGFTAILYST